MSKLRILLIWSTMFLLEFSCGSYGQEIGEKIPEEFVRLATEGEDIIIGCSFSLVEIMGDNNPNKNPFTDTNIAWIYPNYNYTTINGSRINEEKIFFNSSIFSTLRIASSKSATDQGFYTCLLFQDRALLSQKQIYINFTTNNDEIIMNSDNVTNFDESIKNQTDSSSNATILMPKVKYIIISPTKNISLSSDNTSSPSIILNNPPDQIKTKSNTTLISILITAIILLSIIIIIILWLIYKRKKKPTLRNNSPYVRYDRNNSVNSSIELSPYSPTPLS